MELAGKNCLIVGASGAIGQSVAHAFYQQGANLALTYHTKKTTEPLNGVSEWDKRVATFPLDVRRLKQVESVVARVERKFGPIGVLVNCSGVLGPVGATHNVPPKEWRRALEINLFGAFYLVRAVVPSMLATGGGKIILLSGGGAAYSRPQFTAYATSKVAVVRFTENLAVELGDKNIQVNAIAPGPVKSRMWEELRASGEAAGAKALEELKNMDANGGVPPERAAALAVFLASDRSNGLSGRLISAIHDKWEECGPLISEIMCSEAGTLRRVPLSVTT